MLLLFAHAPRQHEQLCERRFESAVALDLAADVADDAAEIGAQLLEHPIGAVELLGVGITPRHHRRLLGDADVGLPQSHAVTAGQVIEARDRGMEKLGVGREGDVLGLHRGVDRDPRQVLGPQRTACVGHLQALGQQ